MFEFRGDLGDAGDGLKGLCTAKLEQHVRPRRGGRGRRDSVNSRSPRDRGECSELPDDIVALSHMHASPAAHLFAAHGFHVSIIDDLIRNLLISARGGVTTIIKSEIYNQDTVLILIRCPLKSQLEHTIRNSEGRKCLHGS